MLGFYSVRRAMFSFMISKAAASTCTRSLAIDLHVGVCIGVSSRSV